MTGLSRLVVISAQEEFVHKINDLFSSCHCGSTSIEMLVCVKPRTIKKALKQADVIGVLFDLTYPESLPCASEIAKYVRQGLNDRQRILIGISDVEKIDTSLSSALDYCFDSDIDNQTTLPRIIQRESRVYQQNSQTSRRQEQETDLLASIAQFSRQELPLNFLLKDFSERTKMLVNAELSLCMDWNQEDQAQFYQLGDNEEKVDEASLVLESLLKHWVQSSYGNKLLQSTSENNRPHIELLESSESIQLNGLAALLIFPIRRFNKTLRLFLFPLTEVAAAGVSLQTVNVLTKASEQLSIVIERRFAGKKLAAQYKKTKDALFELSRAKEELVQQEKLASIGQLAAGVAHEINNPLSFVLSNLEPLEEYVDEFKTLFQLHDQLIENIGTRDSDQTEEMASNIKNKKVEIDQEFILQDLRAIVQESRNGLLRVKDIISDLRAFARETPTEVEHQQVAQVMQESLYFLKHEIPDEITVDVDLSADLTVNAHAGYIGQIFTNLIKNACDALMELDKQEKTITICGAESEQGTRITIRDNGPGISPDVLKKIYDPFFTTKAVGEGTGLGLSITRKLVESMRATIECESVAGEYTQFTLIFNNKALKAA